jgi:hypothetical protein
MMKTLLKISILFLTLITGMSAYAQTVISNLAVTGQTATSATISWNSSTPSTTQLLFGINGVLDSNTVLDPTLVTSHTATISGIFSNAIFSYAAVSLDGSSNKTQSPTQTFELCSSNGSGIPGFTQVSGTINNYYEYGTYSLNWVNQSGQSITPTVCGTPIATTLAGSLSSAGTFNVNVPDNLQVVPSPSQWTVTVRSTGGIGSFSLAAQTITGSSVNLDNALMVGAVGFTTHCFIDQSTGLSYPPNCSGGSGGSPVAGTLNHVAKITPNNNSVGDSEGIATGIAPVRWPLGITLGGGSLHITLPNNTPTGTTCNLLAALDINGNAVDAQSTDTNNLIGISGANCGTTGSVDVAYSGQHPCIFDNQTAPRDWVVLGTGSQCHDAGAVEPTGVQNVGRVSSVNAGAGTTATVYLGLPNITAPSGNSGTVGNCNTPLAIAFYHVVGGAVICDPAFTDDGSGNANANTLTLNGTGAGFLGFGQSAVPALSAANTAYLYADTSVPQTFGTTLPPVPGVLGQILAITSVPDSTHIKTGWVTGSGGGTTIVGPPTNGIQVIGNGSVFTGQAKPVYDVRDAGVVLDGSTDNTASMNTLLSSIGSNPATITFPSSTGGKAKLNPISFPANVTLDFSGGGALQAATSSTAPGGAGYVNGTSAECGSASSCSPPALSTSAGGTLVVLAAPYPGFTFVFNSVTDTCGDLFLHVQQSTVGNPRNVGAWVASNIAGGSCTITATASGTLTNSQVIVQQFSGLGPIVVADGVGASNPSTGTTMSSGSTTTTAGSLLIGYGGQAFTAETCTAGAGYTQPSGIAGQTATGYLCAEYKLSSAGGSTSATQTITIDPAGTGGSWVYNLLALKPGSATINILGGIVDPDLHQIFYNATGTAGIIDFSGSTVLTQIYPEWWGATPSASATVNTPALQAAEHGAFGTGRTNASGLSKYNRPLYLSGNYKINGELQFYDVLNFKVTCNRRLSGGITQTATNLRIIDGQSIAYGTFEDCTWTNSAASTNAQIDLDYDGVETAGDLRPQFIDFPHNTFIGNGITDVGVLIAKSGGGAQGSNIYCFDCAASGFTGAAWQVGGNNTGRNVGRVYAQNALAIGWYGGDIQASPLYGIASYGGGHIFARDVSMENGFASQIGFDMYCEAPQGPCIMDDVRSESRRLIAGDRLQVTDSYTIDQSTFPTPSITQPIGAIIKGSFVGGNGAYQKVTNTGAFGGAGTPAIPESATSGGATSITNSGASYTVNAFTGFLASIVSGTGIGEYCIITSNTATVNTCTGGWLTKYSRLPIVNPDATSKYIVEPNWGTQFTSGAATWVDLNENGIEGSVGGLTSRGRLERVDVPGDKINLGPYSTLKNVGVTRPDWMKSILLDNTNSTSDLDGVLVDDTVSRGGATFYQNQILPRNGNAGNGVFNGYAQKNMGTVPICWSAGQAGGGLAAKDVCIGGRSDGASTTSFSRAVMEFFGGPIGRASAFGTDQNGTDMDIQGGLPTGAGTPGKINFWIGTTGSTGSSVADGTIVTSLKKDGFTNLNGIQFANTSTTVQQAMTASAGGLTEVPPIYAGADIPVGTQINSLTTPASSAQTDHAVNIDNRFGSVNYSFFNPNTEGQGNFANAFGVIGNYTKVSAPVPSNQFLFAVQDNLYDGGSNYSGNKTNWGAGVFYMNAWTPGQHIATGGQCLGYAVGDCLAASYTAVGGGANAPTDEGTTLGDINISQSPVAAVGTISSGGATGATSLTIAFSAGGGTQGAGRYLIKTPGTSTGTVTTIAGTGPVLYTFTGVAFSTDTITTATTSIAAPGSVTLSIPSTTGITANSTLVCISDAAAYECVIPTAVSANASITAVFRKPHTLPSVSWGPNVSKLIELDLDRWTATGQIGFVNVLNTLRFAWPIVNCPTSTTCNVWISVGGGYNSYTGLAKTSAATNSYHIYPAAEIVSVATAGTISNTITLAPNNVAWANSDAIEVPIYPGAKIGLWNAQINRFNASPNLSASGAGVTFNGRFSDSDGFWGVDFKPDSNANYSGHGGNSTVPLCAFCWNKGGVSQGPIRFGLYLNNRPDSAAVNVGAPLDSSGNSNTNINSWFTPGPILNVAGNGQTGSLNYNPGLAQWAFRNDSSSWFVIPKLTGAAITVTGAVDPSLEVGYVSCTQANCASSATTLYTTPAADSLYKADASIACSTSTATATGTVTISYTDVSNTVQTIVSSAATCTTLGSASVAAFSTPFMAKASTAIQYSVTQANSPAGLRARVAIYQESTN